MRGPLDFLLKSGSGLDPDALQCSKYDSIARTGQQTPPVHTMVIVLPFPNWSVWKNGGIPSSGPLTMKYSFWPGTRRMLSGIGKLPNSQKPKEGKGHGST